MASNGYVRRKCDLCIFYRSDREYGEECILYDDMWNADGMRWVSSNDYNSNPEVAAKHDEPCEHYTNIYEVRNQIREKLGIEKVKINEYCM
jgi:hypothetical protein